MSDLNAIIGIVLIVLAFILFITAVPTLNTSVSTAPNTTLENETSTIKTIYSINGLLIAMLPIMVFIMGLGMIWKG